MRHELGHGGMGVVYLARDPRLDRLVAIKVLRPERFTAEAAERFRREAKFHAQVTDPHVVPIHTAGEADGLSYYVMDYVEGGTLAERLKHGPLPIDEVRALGLSLLAAVAAVHARGIIHRDIKPGNVFLGRGGLLADFGIARSSDEEPLTEDGRGIGTRAYMAPEQRAGSAVPESDLYAVGAVLYEAATGYCWPEGANRANLPRRLSRVLRRALAEVPAERWRSPERFRRALEKPTLDRQALHLAALVALGALVGLLVRIALPKTPPSPMTPVDLAVVPFADPLEAQGIGREVARYASEALEWYPGWSVRPGPAAFAWWDSVPPAKHAAAARALAARRLVEGEIVHRPQGGLARIAIRDSTGTLLQLLDIPGTPTDPFTWGRAVADSIVRRLNPAQIEDYRHATRVAGSSVPAYKEFFRGQEAFRRDNWIAAETHYRRALELDPDFAHAAWELALVRWWRREAAPADLLRDLYEQHRDELPGLQRLLTEGLLLSDPEQRLERFAQAVRDYPSNGDGLLLFGNELFTRGPLVGIPVDSGVRMFEASTTREVFATALAHAALGHIRLGDRQAASRDIRSLPRPSDSADAENKLRSGLLRFGYDERFVPWRARVKEVLLGWRPDSALLGGIGQYARFANFFDVPDAELALGRILARSGPDAGARAGGQEAEGLASLILGRPIAALEHLDSAALLFATPEAELQRAQWRVLLAPLGLGTPPSADVVEAGRELTAVSEKPLASRAAWTLAVAALHRGDRADADRWTARIAADTVGRPDSRALHQLLLAMTAARRGSLDSATAIARPLLRYDPGGLGGDPFARAMLHLELGDWLVRLGNFRDAERVWLWTDAWDVQGWAQREAQAGEVDAAVGALARLKRGELALRVGDRPRACTYLTRVRELWRNAEPALGPQRALADSLASTCP